MTNNWNDFNSADDQQSFEIIPKGTLVKVRMTIKPGGFDDASQGWTGGFATRSMNTGAVYLQAEFVVLEGQYARRKIWSNIGLYSEKGPTWGNMGRTFIKGTLNSAFGLNPKDNSPQAQQKRQIQGLESLVGLEFVGRVDFEKDQYGEDRNVIKNVITPEHKEYAKVMGKIATHHATPSTQPAPSPAVTPPPPPVETPAGKNAPADLTRPRWA